MRNLVNFIITGNKGTDRIFSLFSPLCAYSKCSLATRTRSRQRPND